jgi:hypothetical protein
MDTHEIQKFIRAYFTAIGFGHYTTYSGNYKSHEWYLKKNKEVIIVMLYCTTTLNQKFEPTILETILSEHIPEHVIMFNNEIYITSRLNINKDTSSKDLTEKLDDMIKSKQTIIRNLT